MNTSIFYNIRWIGALLLAMVSCGPNDDKPVPPANQSNCEAIVISDLEKRYYMPAQTGWRYIYRVHVDSNILKLAPDYPIPFDDTLNAYNDGLLFDSSKATPCMPYHTSSTYNVLLKGSAPRTIPMKSEGDISTSIYRMDNFYHAQPKNSGIMQIGLYGQEVRLKDNGNGRWALIQDGIIAQAISVQLDTLASYTVLGQPYAKVIRFSWEQNALYFAPDVGLIEAKMDSSHVCQLVALNK
jgi:hypothetical protein